MFARDRIDRALRSATAFLLNRQSPDGAWRSTIYGPFKTGDALTPLVLRALTATPFLSDVLPRLRKGAVRARRLHVPPLHLRSCRPDMQTGVVT